MAGAKKLVTLVFILVPARGAVCPAVVCSRHYIALHRGARRGGIQARRERRPGLHVPEALIEASANIVVEAECVRVCCSLLSCPRGWGITLPSSPTVSQLPSSPCSTGSEGGISCKQRSFIVSIHSFETQVLDYSTQGSLPLEMWSP
jgi:hypothetical protein